VWYFQVAQTLQVHITQFMRDPQKWRVALSPELESTKQWESTVQKVGQFAMVTGLMFTHRLVEAGIVSYNAASGRLGLKTGTDQADHIENTVRLAQYFEVVKNRRATAGITREQRRDYLKLAARIRGTIFTDGTNSHYEFAFDKQATSWSSSARNPETGRVVTSTPDGQLLELQLNAFQMGVSAINGAILADHAWIIGRCVRGAEPGRSIDIALGVCRP